MSFHQSYPNRPLVEAIIIVISCPKATVPAVMSNPESDRDVFTVCVSHYRIVISLNQNLIIWPMKESSKSIINNSSTKQRKITKLKNNAFIVHCGIFRLHKCICCVSGFKVHVVVGQPLQTCTNQRNDTI